MLAGSRDSVPGRSPQRAKLPAPCFRRAENGVKNAVALCRMHGNQFSGENGQVWLSASAYSLIFMKSQKRAAARYHLQQLLKKQKKIPEPSPGFQNKIEQKKGDNKTSDNNSIFLDYFHHCYYTSFQGFRQVLSSKNQIYRIFLYNLYRVPNRRISKDFRDSTNV